MNKEEPTVKIGISIPESILDAVDNMAFQMNTTRREIILGGIELVVRFGKAEVQQKDGLFVRKDSPPLPTGPDNEFVKW